MDGTILISWLEQHNSDISMYIDVQKLLAFKISYKVSVFTTSL